MKLNDHNYGFKKESKYRYKENSKEKVVQIVYKVGKDCLEALK